MRALLALLALTGAARAAELELVPEFVRPLAADHGRPSNDSSPTWAPNGSMIAFERAEESRREIVVVRMDGTPVRTVYYQANGDDDGLAALLPGLGLSTSYNSGLSWSRSGEGFVFMSNAGEGNYDLYLGNIASKATLRLTDSPQKDGQPDWSPMERTVAFVSGRDGGARLYLLDVDSRRTAPVSVGELAYLYPRWSPDGRRIAAIYGANENHDIVVLDGDWRAALAPPPAKSGAVAAVATPAITQRALTRWKYDDLSPSWSPDGKHIAFYTNQNEEDDPKIWSIAVVDASGASPAEGEGLVAQVVARNVIPDVHMGPAWLPDSRRLAYVRNDKQDYSPIFIVDIESRQQWHLATGTNINHDLAISPQGVLAFRAQVNQWDRLFLTRLPN